MTSEHINHRFEQAVAAYRKTMPNCATIAETLRIVSTPEYKAKNLRHANRMTRISQRCERLSRANGWK